MAVLAIEGDADGGAIVEFDQAGALNVHDEGFEPVRHEKKFQALAREGAGLDFRAREVRLEAAWAFPARGEPLIAQRMTRQERGQIGRPAIDRRREGGGLLARALEHRLEIGCQEAGAAKTRMAPKGCSKNARAFAGP